MTRGWTHKDKIIIHVAHLFLYGCYQLINSDQLYRKLLWKWKRSYQAGAFDAFTSVLHRWRAKAPRNPQNASTVLNLDADTYKAKYEVTCPAFTIHALLFISQTSRRKILCVSAFFKRQDKFLSVKFVLELNYADRVFMIFLF